MFGLFVRISLIVFLFAVPGWAATYNIGAGKTYTTFTLLEASEVLAAGDVVDGGGGEFRETWTPATGGSSGNPIILQNAIINASDIMTGFAGPDGNGEYTKGSVTTEPQLVLSDGVLLPEGTNGSLAADEWDWDSNTLYLGFDPTSNTIEAGQRSYGVLITDVDYITMDNLTVKNANAKSIYIRSVPVSIKDDDAADDDTADWSVTDCTLVFDTDHYEVTYAADTQWVWITKPDYIEENKRYEFEFDIKDGTTSSQLIYWGAGNDNLWTSWESQGSMTTTSSWVTHTVYYTGDASDAVLGFYVEMPSGDIEIRNITINEIPSITGNTISNSDLIYANEQIILNDGGLNFTATGNTITGGLLDVHYASGGIQTRNQDNPTITNNEISLAKFGVQVGGTSITVGTTQGTISDNYIHDLGVDQDSYIAADWQGIELTGDSNTSIDGLDVYKNKLIDIAGACIGIYYADSNTVYNNVMSNCGNDKFAGAATNEGAISLWNESVSNLLYSNTIYNPRDGILITLNANNNNVVENTIIKDANRYGLFISSSTSGNTSDYNCIEGSTTDDWGDAASQGANSLSSDPLFLNATNYDFRVPFNSPVVDAGTSLSIHVDGWTDFNGNQFGCGNAFDIGANEHCWDSEWPPLSIALDNDNKLMAWYTGAFPTYPFVSSAGNHFVSSAGNFFVSQ